MDNMKKRLIHHFFSTFTIVLVSIMLSLSTPFAIFAQNSAAIISDLDWNPNGSQIAIGISAYGNGYRCAGIPNSQDIHILNTVSQQMTIISRTNQICSVTNVDFSPDGSQLLTTSDSYLAIWNVVNGQLIQSLTMSAVFQHAFWSPDGLALLDVRSTGVDIRNPTNLAESYRALIAPGRLENKFFTYSVWSPDDNSVASSTSDGKIYVWDAATKNVLIIFSAHTAPVQRLVWNTALNLIASGDDSGEILVWNPSTGTTVSELDGHAGAIRDLDWRSDGQQLVSASDDNTVRTWAWPSGQMNMVENGQSVWSVAYSPDGSQLAYAGDVTDPQNIAAQIVVTSSISSTPTATFTPTATDTPTNTPTSRFEPINTPGAAHINH